MAQTQTGEVKALRPKKHGWGYDLRRNKIIYLMFLPVIVYYVIFHYLPMFGVVMAFMKYKPAKGFFGSQWVGMANYVKFFRGPYALNLIRNTIVLNGMLVLFGFPAPIIFALLLNEMPANGYKKLCQTVSYMPHFVSAVVACGIVILFVQSNGLVTSLLAALRLVPREDLLAYSKYFRSIYVVSDIWQSIGWGSIIYLATLSNVDMNLYEAADIDGAGRLRKIWHVTLPALANTIITVLILNLAKIMNLFESVFVLQNDAVRRYTHVLQTYVYQQTFAVTNPNYGYTTAVGLFRSMVGMALFLICNYASKKVRGRGIV